ncbi:MAG: hypothetical protein LJE65_14495 [Desulfobacteraceae bacterium]|nr:hypothetical protein [Desulfobacteraceae bacterium]
MSGTPGETVDERVRSEVEAIVSVGFSFEKKCTAPEKTVATSGLPFSCDIFSGPSGGEVEPGTDERVDDETDQEGVEAEDPWIRCRQCSHNIARASDRVSVQGAHVHTFANPHGLVFEIGCFRDAAGCAIMGLATDEFTWFHGFRWRVSYCGRCLSHLGWKFTSETGGQFFGLILERLNAS